MFGEASVLKKRDDAECDHCELNMKSTNNWNQEKI